MSLKFGFIFIMTIFLSVFGNAQSDSLISEFSFSSSTSENFDTLFTDLTIDAPIDSLLDYQLELTLNTIVDGDTSMVDFIEIELVDLSASGIESIAFNEVSGEYQIVIGMFPSGNYLLSAAIRNSLGIVIDESTLLAE